MGIFCALDFSPAVRKRVQEKGFPTSDKRGAGAPPRSITIIIPTIPTPPCPAPHWPSHPFNTVIQQCEVAQRDSVPERYMLKPSSGPAAVCAEGEQLSSTPTQECVCVCVGGEGRVCGGERRKSFIKLYLHSVIWNKREADWSFQATVWSAISAHQYSRRTISSAALL